MTNVVVADARRSFVCSRFGFVMRRLVQFFIGSSLIFLAILSVFNLALFLETAKLAETGPDGSFMVEDVFPRLWKAFGVVGALFLIHFVVSATIAGVYWLCWRPSRKERLEASGDPSSEPRRVSLFGEPRPLSPFFAALFALVVLFPLLTRGIGGAYRNLTSFLEQRIAPTPALEPDSSPEPSTPLPAVAPATPEESEPQGETTDSSEAI